MFACPSHDVHHFLILSQIMHTLCSIFVFSFSIYNFLNYFAQKVRIAALGCLCELTNLPSHAVVPHKTNVLRTLVTALDDHKRLVRQEAVQARCEW